MRATDLLRRLEDRPFKPFRIHLTDGTTLEVLQAGMVVVGAHSAVVPSRYGKVVRGIRLAEDWRTIDILHITQFSDLSERSNGKHRRRRTG